VSANREKPSKADRALRKRAAGIANLVEFNASRNGKPNLGSGVFTAVASGGAELPPVPGADEIAERVDAIVGQMATDLGAERVEDLPAAQRAILESQRLNLLVLGLANRFLRAEGVTNRRGKPHALLTVCVSFSNSLRHNALALGLERKARRVGATDLASYLNLREADGTAPGAAIDAPTGASQPDVPIEVIP
jgi:hypothetical protein